MRRLFKNLKSNRGSGIITVLVAMMIIAVLGSALLFTSYIGYRVKIADRHAKESFYRASAVMDEIKSGIQQAVTESLSTAYSNVLSEYMSLYSLGDEAVHDRFSELFLIALQEWKAPSTGTEISLFESPGRYSVDALYAFVSEHPVEDSFSIDGSGNVTSDADGGWIKLEDISVIYTISKGYQSRVTSDILITMPDFHATTLAVVSSGLPSFAIIANGTLSSNINDPVITGNAYAGEVSLALGDNRLTYADGTFICGGAIEIKNGARLRTNSGTELWAENIKLGEEGVSGFNNIAELYGRTFVADDLTLAGNGSRAELKGSYCGFGLGSTAGTSSAIIVNGRNTVLDISGLDRLILAGVSFIKTSGNESLNGAAPLTGDVRTGESISVRSNQMAYLIDKSCFTDIFSYYDRNGNDTYDEGVDTLGTITGSNPFLFAGDHLSYAINTSPLADYLEGNANNVIPVSKNLVGTGGYKIAYFYINFPNQDKANEYFRDYFSANPRQIEEYVNIYVNLSNQAKSTRSSGNTLYKDNSGELKIMAASEEVDVQGLALEFSNLRQTLNPNKGASGITPYEYYVNKSAITGNREFSLPENPGEVVARIIDGNYLVSSSEKAKVIIATGNVTVNSDFSGLIIAGGNVTVNGNLTYSHSYVEDILHRATDGDGNLLSSYLLITDAGSGGSSSFTSSWDLDLLVSYENWTKD